jgi:D-sedoheptulose 7-phosphate isomerase
MDAMEKRIKDAMADSIRVKVELFGNPSTIDVVARMATSMIEIYRGGGKLLIAGNGGSAADAQHFAAEITCQYKLERKARPALALHCDTSALTAWGNDKSFKTAFARQVEAHGRKGDGLVLISTSGNSEDLLYATEMGRVMELHTFGLLGRDGGKLSGLRLCDEEIIVRSNDTPRIQESHIMIIHMLCEELDRFFYAQDQGAPVKL